VHQQTVYGQAGLIRPRNDTSNMWLQAPSTKRARVEPPSSSVFANGAQYGGGAMQSTAAASLPVATSSGRSAEIKFDSPQAAAYAMQEADGTMYESHLINVTPLDAAQQSSKLLVHNLPPYAAWKSIKDHFRQWGNVVHVALWGLPEDGVTVDGEVRFENAAEAAEALKLNGSLFAGVAITVELDPGSQDQAKVKITGLPHGTRWQELKDHFSGVGTIAFAGIKGVDGAVGKANWAVPQYGATLDGEVRFEDAALAYEALKLSGSLFNGVCIGVELDPGSQDQAKVKVTGLPHGTRWQELKDYFAGIGPIAFAGIKGVDGVSGKANWANMPANMNHQLQQQMSAVLAAVLGQAQPQHYARPGFPPNRFARSAGGQAQLLQQATQMLLQSQCLGGGGVGPAMGRARLGEVRFEGPAASSAVQVAIDSYNGMDYKGYVLSVSTHTASQDGTKISVGNLPPQTAWQELKDLFAECGPVAFANVR